MQIIEKATYQRPAGIRNILLIQLGDIGDVVWTTPAIRAVRESMPDTRISVLVKDGFGGLLEADPSVAHVYEVRRYSGSVFQQAGGHVSFLRDIRSRHFDLAVDLRLGDRGAWMAFFSGAPMRMTMHHPEDVPWWRRFLFTHAAVPADLPPEQGAAEQTLRILRVLGIDTDDKIPRLWIAENVKQRITDMLTGEKLGAARWISINPFSRWSYKEWDEAKWVEILDWLWSTFAIPVVLVGSPEERPRADALMKHSGAKLFNFAGRTTLAELAGLLSQSSLHIGVDSAAPHIAAAVGVRTVILYGPSDGRYWAPPGDRHLVVTPADECAPCLQKGCEGKGRSRCLEEMPVERVMEAIEQMVRGLDAGPEPR